jgi:hypothetical protein
MSTASRARWLKLCGCALCWSICLTPQKATAQDRNSLANSDLPATVSEARAGVLVMRNGAVLTGIISRVDGLYEVQGDSGTVQVPSDFVKLRADSLVGAYEQLHGQAVARQNAESHISLAKWCASNHLDHQARQELEAALALEPEQEQAKWMLQTLATEKPRRESTAAGPTAGADSTPSSSSPAEADPRVSGRLSNSLNIEYSRHIQPLLVKTCATAGCHTRDSKLDLQLIHVIPGKTTNRTASERNLAAILQRIDTQHPENSPLLTAARRPHGGNAKRLFSGQKGSRQLADLEDWVKAAAREEPVIRSTATDKSGTERAVKNSPQVAKATAKSQPDPFDSQTITPAIPVKGQRRPSNVRESADYDPFDPAKFNRQSSSTTQRR